jgi:uncharacterized cofD-like protein
MTRSMPRVVAIGGGHGLAATIRAIRQYASTATAIVATADDGGSTGRIRAGFDVPAPGDLRRCFVAMADLGRWSEVVEHRFASGDVEGHAVGNLLIAALVEVTGDFLQACDEVARLFGLDPERRRVLPATVEPVMLRAAAAGGVVDGQVAITHATGIERLELVPPDATVPKEAVDAILTADQIVIGPGSLYTSVLAAALPEAIAGALTETTAQRVYVCNLRAELAETREYDVADHVAALAAHGITVDVVVHQEDGLARGALEIPAVAADLARPNGLAHDPDKLAAALAAIGGG